MSEVSGKALLHSKTFWLNVLAFAANYAGYLPAPAALYAVPAANLFLRYITKHPIKGLV